MARCGFAVAAPNLGPFANPAEIVSLAQLAENAGWDGFFLWDHLLWTWPEPTDVIAPWPVLGAIADSAPPTRTSHPSGRFPPMGPRQHPESSKWQNSATAGGASTMACSF